MIEAFHKAISTGHQNTYKFALGLAILQEYESDPKLDLLRIAARLAAYYYRNHLIFKLRETNNPDQEPVAILVLKRLVEEFYKGGTPPKNMEKRFKDTYAKALLEPPLDIGRSVLTYVLPCWQGAAKNPKGYYDYPSAGENDFFSYSKGIGLLEISPEFQLALKEHRRTLQSLTVLEWARFLEKFNQTPNLISKLSLKKPLRRISKFRPIFHQTPIMRSEICHLCGLPIQDGQWTQDHIIPFDYIYSDDLLNLAPAHKSCNSKKGARVGSDNMIKRLIERNRRLWELDGTLAQRWIMASAGSLQELENKILSSADSAIKAGFRQVDDSDFRS